MMNISTSALVSPLSDGLLVPAASRLAVPSIAASRDGLTSETMAALVRSGAEPLEGVGCREPDEEKLTLADLAWLVAGVAAILALGRVVNLAMT